MKIIRIIRNKLSLALLALLWCVAGCSGIDQADPDPEFAALDAAQTWGVGGINVPTSLQVEPGDVVDQFIYKCTVSAAADEQVKLVESYKCGVAASRECTLDGGSTIGVTPALQCWAGEATCTIVVAVSCLYKASDG